MHPETPYWLPSLLPVGAHSEAAHSLSPGYILLETNFRVVAYTGKHDYNYYYTLNVIINTNSHCIIQWNLSNQDRRKCPD